MKKSNKNKNKNRRVSCYPLSFSPSFNKIIDNLIPDELKINEESKKFNLNINIDNDNKDSLYSLTKINSLSNKKRNSDYKKLKNNIVLSLGTEDKKILPKKSNEKKMLTTTTRTLHKNFSEGAFSIFDRTKKNQLLMLENKFKLERNRPYHYHSRSSYEFIQSDLLNKIILTLEGVKKLVIDPSSGLTDSVPSKINNNKSNKNIEIQVGTPKLRKKERVSSSRPLIINQKYLQFSPNKKNSTNKNPLYINDVHTLYEFYSHKNEGKTNNKFKIKDVNSAINIKPYSPRQTNKYITNEDKELLPANVNNNYIKNEKYYMIKDFPSNDEKTYTYINGKKNKKRYLGFNKKCQCP